MRAFALATATGLVALTTAFASPATAQQGNVALVLKLCPEMTYTQVTQGLTEMAEDGYQLPTDPDKDKVAAQIAYDLCGAGYNADTAEADADLEDQQGPGTIPAAVGPPQRGHQFGNPNANPDLAHPAYRPRHDGPPPRRYGHPQRPMPWFMKKRPMPPHAHRAPPRYGYGGYPPPRPRFGKPLRRAAPPAAMAMAPSGGYGYGGRGSYEQRPAGPLPFVKSERGSPYCPSEEVLMSRIPQGYPPGACVVSQIPGKPCPGLKCDRR